MDWYTDSVPRGSAAVKTRTVMNDCITRGAEKTVSYPLALRIASEFASSLVVCFAIYAVSTLGTAMYGVNMAFVAVATGLAYMAAAVVFGRVSGAQTNPAVTLAAMLMGRTRIVDGVSYIVAQLVGALGAGALIVKLLPTSSTLTAKIWLTPAVNGFDDGSVSYSTLSSVNVTFSIALAVIVELIGALIVISTVLRAMDQDGHVDAAHTGFIAVAYGIAAGITYPVTGSGLNPARSTGIAIFAQNHGLAQEPLQQLWIFWICPVLAAALVSLVVIVSQMVLNPRPASVPQTFQNAVTASDADANGDEDSVVDDAQTADDAQTDAESESAVESDGHVEDDESESQSESDEGVETH